MDDFDFSWSDDFDSLGGSGGSNTSNWYDSFDSLGEQFGNITDGNWDFGSMIPDDLSGFFGSSEWLNSLNENTPVDNSAIVGSMGDAPMAGMWSNAGGTDGSISSTLSQLFNSKTMPLVGKGLAALYEGNQNKKQASALKNIASSAALDPFGSQRPFYQDQVKQALTNPTSVPIIKTQMDQIAKAQAIKDAAAGRRSNSATSSPAMLAAQSQIAQNYANSLLGAAGANISPNTGASANALTSAAKYDTNGYISPLLSLLGNMTQGNANSKATTGNNSNYINALSDFLFKD